MATDCSPRLVKRVNQRIWFRTQNVGSVCRFRELRPLACGLLPQVIKEQLLLCTLCGHFTQLNEPKERPGSETPIKMFTSKRIKCLMPTEIAVATVGTCLVEEVAVTSRVNVLTRDERVLGSGTGL